MLLFDLLHSRPAFHIHGRAEYDEFIAMAEENNLLWEDGREPSIFTPRVLSEDPKLDIWIFLDNRLTWWTRIEDIRDKYTPYEFSELTTDAPEMEPAPTGDFLALLNGT